jgi:hypothetical protein
MPFLPNAVFLSADILRPGAYKPPPLLAYLQILSLPDSSEKPTLIVYRPLPDDKAPPLEFILRWWESYVGPRDTLAGVFII